MRAAKLSTGVVPGLTFMLLLAGCTSGDSEPQVQTEPTEPEPAAVAESQETPAEEEVPESPQEAESPQAAEDGPQESTESDSSVQPAAAEPDTVTVAEESSQESPEPEPIAQTADSETESAPMPEAEEPAQFTGGLASTFFKKAVRGASKARKAARKVSKARRAVSTADRVANKIKNVTSEVESAAETANEVKETVARWVERARFWDKVNRLRLQAYKKPARLSASGIRAYLQGIDDARQLSNHVDKLASELQGRRWILKAQPIDTLILNSIRAETTIPAWFTQLRVYLSVTDVASDIQNSDTVDLNDLQQAILRNQVSEGHLLDLYICLRGRLTDLITLREHEYQQDVAFTFLTPYKLESLGLDDAEYDLEEAVIREHRARLSELGDFVPKKPKEPKKKESRRRSSAARPFDLTYEELTADAGDGNDVLAIKGKDYIEHLKDACKTIEEIRGGTEPFLVFPEISELPSRKVLIKASDEMFRRIKEADKATADQVFDFFAKGLTEEELDLVVDLEKPAPTRLPDRPTNYSRLTPEERVKERLPPWKGMVMFGREFRRAMAGELDIETVLEKEKDVRSGGLLGVQKDEKDWLINIYRKRKPENRNKAIKEHEDYVLKIPEKALGI